MTRLSQDERDAFRERLHQVLVAHGYDPKKFSIFAREFNLRSPMPITICGARKWLLGESMPNQAHLRILSRWLGADIAWLRFGDRDEPVLDPDEVMHTDALRVACDLQMLSKESFNLVRGLVQALVNKEKETA